MAANPDLSPLERLLAEAIPTGTFGHARPTPERRRAAQAPSAASRREAYTNLWTPEEQAQHVADLEAELDRLEGRDTGRPDRHLHAVDSDAA